MTKRHGLSLIVFLCVAALSGATTVEDFDGKVGRWEVVEDPTAPNGDHTLAQLAKNSSSTFNVALERGRNLQNVDITVSFKSIDGKIDQGGGLVWRAKDADN